MTGQGVQEEQEVASKLGELHVRSVEDQPVWLVELSRRARRTDITDTLFFPIAEAEWRRGRQRLPRQLSRSTATRIDGVRIQAAEPEDSGDPTRATEVQSDLTNLVSSLRELRKTPGCAGLVLSGRSLPCRQPVRGRVLKDLGKRVRFGLELPKTDDHQAVTAASLGGAAQDDKTAAARSHRAIVRAVHRAGFLIESPKKFDAASGLAGLEAWASIVRLRRWPRPPAWLLLLLLLPLLWFASPSCTAADFMGIDLGTNNLIVILDASGSMADVFPRVREEARKTLDQLQNGWWRECHVDLISYKDVPLSALGEMKPVGAESSAELALYLDALEASTGNNLRNALAKAAEEVRALGEPTTLIIFSDGEVDPTIQAMVNDPSSLLDQFGDVPIIGHSLTPRLLTEEGRIAPAPINDAEQGLAALAAKLGGDFGPLGANVGGL